jgi:hypothetical protein
VPLIEKTLDPYMRAHWRLLLSSEPNVRSAYNDHFLSLADGKHDFRHMRTVASVGLSSMARCKTLRQLKAFLRTYFTSGQELGFDEVRSGKDRLVISTSIVDGIDAVLVLAEIRFTGSTSPTHLRCG